jgi:magnesium chelatase family protein
VDPAEVHTKKSCLETSAEVKSRVCRARESQTARACNINAHLTQSELQQVAPLRHETQLFLSEAGSQLGFFVRGHYRVLRVARTIADLEGTAALTEEHLAEALQYRVPDRAEAGLA